MSNSNAAELWLANERKKLKKTTTSEPSPKKAVKVAAPTPLFTHTTLSQLMLSEARRSSPGGELIAIVIVFSFIIWFLATAFQNGTKATILMALGVALVGILGFLQALVLKTNTQGWHRRDISAYKPTLSGKGLVIFFLFLSLGIAFGLFVCDANVGCASSGGYAMSISRVSASIIPFGYVYMAVALLTLNLVMQSELAGVHKQRMDVLSDHTIEGCTAHVPWGAMLRSERMMQVGLSTTVVTAVIPDLASNCDLVEHVQSCWQTELSTFHLVGIAGGIFLSSVGAALRVHASLSIAPVRILSMARATRPHRIALMVLLLLFGAEAMCAHIFLSTGGENAAQAHICILHKTRADCEGRFLDDYSNNAYAKAQWPCVWDPDKSFEDVACTNPNCVAYLDKNQQSIAFEYLTILIWSVMLSWSLGIVQDVESEQSLGSPWVAPLPDPRMLL